MICNLEEAQWRRLPDRNMHEDMTVKLRANRPQSRHLPSQP
jgi:hypothetical protein